MAINLLAFLLTRTVAEKRGASEADANRVGLVSSMFKSPVLGVVLATAVRVNTPEAPKSHKATPAGAPAGTSAGTSAGAPAGTSAGTPAGISAGTPAGAPAGTPAKLLRRPGLRGKRL